MADYIFTLTFAAEVCLKVAIFLFIDSIIISRSGISSRSTIVPSSSLVVHEDHCSLLLIISTIPNRGQQSPNLVQPSWDGQGWSAKSWELKIKMGQSYPHFVVIKPGFISPWENTNAENCATLKQKKIECSACKKEKSNKIISKFEFS